MAKHKYKIREKVRVKKNIPYDFGNGTGLLFVSQMKKFEGKIFEIDKIAYHTDTEYKLKGCENWTFTNRMLEPVKISLKSWLKNGNY